MKQQRPVLEIKNLTVPLPLGGDRKFAVKDVSIEVAPGEVVCVVGESGSGKSITASSVMRLGELKPTQGSILVEGEDILAAPSRRMRELRGSRMAMIFQEPMTALNPVYRVGDQVAELLRVHGWSGGERTRRHVERMFEDVRLPDPGRTMRAFPHQLSGGQRQRVMIAMALSLKPALLIADEPTTALDVTTQAQILRLLKDLQQAQGTGVMFITHDFGVVAEIADKVVVMQGGQVVEAGPAVEVLHSPRTEYTRQLIKAIPRLVPRTSGASAGPVVLEVRDLQKTYSVKEFMGGARTVRAVDGVSFSLMRGQTVGIVGESGSGKSTTARCIARLIDPTDGQIVLDGTDISRLGERPLRRYRSRLQMIFQDPYRSLNPRRKVRDSIIEGPLNFGIPMDVCLSRCRTLLKTVGLDESALSRYPHQFSGGQRQRIAIARALAMEPQILIADEAVSALDVSIQAQVLDLLETIQTQTGISILFITHDLRVASRLCDHVLVMRNGKVVEAESTAKLFRNPAHPYTADLISAVPGGSWLNPEAARGGSHQDDQET